MSAPATQLARGLVTAWTHDDLVAWQDLAGETNTVPCDQLIVELVRLASAAIAAGPLRIEQFMAVAALREVARPCPTCFAEVSQGRCWGCGSPPRAL